MCRHRQAAKGAGWGAGEGQVVDPCLPQQTKLLVIMATDLSQCMQKGEKKVESHWPNGYGYSTDAPGY